MTTNHFAVALTSYLESNSIRAKQLENLAGLPNATIAKLTAGQRPSVERLAELLQAVPSPEAAKLLEAYLYDAVPQNWRDAVQIIIFAAETALASAPAAVKDTLTRTLEAINSKARSDIDFAAWLTDTARLLNLITDDDDDDAAAPATVAATEAPEPAVTRPPLTPAQYRATLPTGQPDPLAADSGNPQ